MHRFLFTSGNLIFSLLLGAIAMAICAVWYDEAFATILDIAGRIKIWLANLGVPTRYNNFIRLLVHESNLVFMFFTVASRLVVSAIGNLIIWLVRGRRADVE